jgi:hypothetical protein
MADIKEFEVCIGSQNIKQYFFHTSWKEIFWQFETLVCRDSQFGYH